MMLSSLKPLVSAKMKSILPQPSIALLLYLPTVWATECKKLRWVCLKLQTLMWSLNAINPTFKKPLVT